MQCQELVYVYMYVCNAFMLPPGGHSTACVQDDTASDQLIHGCRLCASSVRRIGDLDKSITSFYPGRLTMTI